VPCGERKFKFRDPLPKNKPMTFYSLFEVKQKDSHSAVVRSIKADRKTLHCLIITSKLDVILICQIYCHINFCQSHKLWQRPMVAFAKEHKHTCLVCPASLDDTDLGEEASLTIDGQALVFAIGKLLESSHVWRPRRCVR